ncbi:hypothetical protein GCM10009784_16600 [Arthrobacter parietis]|uniref:Peptidase S8/S53 domain-containing protein n=1 Tax=Arthrobacter parietis TaxID=271434 RepID=A0ABP5MQI4_9MICC
MPSRFTTAWIHMPFLRSGSRALLPAAMTTAIACSLLVAPSAGASPIPAKVLPDEVVAAPATAGSEATASTGRFIITFEDGPAAVQGAKANAFGRLAKDLGLSVREVRETADGAVVVKADGEVSTVAADGVVAALNELPGIVHVQEDVLMRPLAGVNDPGFRDQWNLFGEPAGLRVPAAWDRSTGAGQTIAILDTGITPHTDLDANVLPGYDFVADPAIAVDGNTGRDADPSDPGDACLDPEPGAEPTESSWHGTHVAGIAAAMGNNSKGMAGVAYRAKLLPLRVMGACGGLLSDTADAIRWAVGGTVAWTENGISHTLPANPHPARVVNMSLGAEEVCSPYLQQAIDFAVQQGSVIIAAAGNESQPATNVMPANCHNVITVGATSRAGNHASYSNFGPEVDFSAPGGDGSTGAENILSTMNSGRTAPVAEAYGYMQGTSMAAPHVAGVAALMLSVNPALSPEDIERILADSTRPLTRACANGCGTGTVDANAAVWWAAGFPPSIRGTADVVAADAAGTLWNYPSNGKGGFAQRARIGSGWSALKNGFVTDWNQDGVLDLVAQWKDGRLTHYAGITSGGFQPAQTIGNGWGSYFVTVGKWRSGDRYPGIVAYDPQGALWHYPNPSGGVLGPRTRIGTGWNGLYLTMTDFDGDSRMDILAKKADGKLIQYRSNGTGQFLSESRRTIGTGWRSVNSMGSLPGFDQSGGQALMTRLTDGRLAYYPFAAGRWAARSIVGSGWSDYNLFR